MRAFLLLLVTVCAAAAATLPLTVKDISLMLRTGYAAATIEQELQARHFAGKLDDAARQQLTQAGATPELLKAIEGGQFAAQPQEVDTLRKRREQQLLRTAVPQREEISKHATEKSAPAGPPLVDVIAQALKGNLVRCQNGNLVSYYDEELDRKRLYGLYFSAHWCVPCRKFTPQLVAFYNQVVRDHPEFEIIFVSADKSADAMAGYMRDAVMPWPAIAFEKVPNASALLKYAGGGIPDLVIVDGTGKVVADSYVNGKYVGPAEVLNNLGGILAGGNAGTVATR